MATTLIKYRISANAPKPTADSVKGVPLTSLEIDGNFRSLKDSIETESGRVDTILSTGINSNAATATALKTARDINGVPFNGTTNITLPTVNTTGNQSISGTKTFNNQIVASAGISGNITGTAANITGTAAVANGGTGATTAAQALINLGVRTGQTGSLLLPVGSTAQRDASPSSGFIRFNSSTLRFEGYNGSLWTSVGGGATGGGNDEIFVENGKTITANYTLAGTRNASTTGPITISDGVSVTISDGARWVIL